MFKMGCSMARRILAIDGKGNSSGQDQLGAGCSSSSSPASSKNQGRKDKQHLASAGGVGDPAASTAATTNAPKTKTIEELNDFSKLEDDPRIPLNVRQIFKITKSWKAIARTMSKTGTAMFLNLFEQNQDLFYLFDRFQHLKGKDLHESMELREHAATVMSTLDQSINSLSDYDNFVNYLHSIGKLHRKVPGFKRAYFWKIEQPFLKAVKQTLDERCNETIEEIYKIAIKLILETIADGFGEDQPNLGDKLDADRDKPASADGGDNANGGGGHKQQQQMPTNGGDIANKHNARGDSDKCRYIVGTTAASATIDSRPKANIHGDDNIATTRDDVELGLDTAASREQTSAPSRSGQLLPLDLTSPIDELAERALHRQIGNSPKVGVEFEEACVHALLGGADDPLDGVSLSPGKNGASKASMSHENGQGATPSLLALPAQLLSPTSNDSRGDRLRSTLFVLKELLFLSLKTEMKRQKEGKAEPKEKTKFEPEKKGTAKAFDGRPRKFSRSGDNNAAFIGHANGAAKAQESEEGNETCSWLARLAGISISSSSRLKFMGEQTTKAPPSSTNSLSWTTPTEDCTDGDCLAPTATRAKTKPTATATKAGKYVKEICNYEKGGNEGNKIDVVDYGDKDDNQEADRCSRELNTSCCHQHRTEPFLLTLSSSFTTDISKRAPRTTARDLHWEAAEATTQACEQLSRECPARNNKAQASSIYLARVDGIEFVGTEERRAKTIVGSQQTSSRRRQRPDGRPDSCSRQLARLQQANLAAAGAGQMTTTSGRRCNNVSEFGGHQKVNEVTNWTPPVATSTTLGEPSKVCAQSKNRQSECRCQWSAVSSALLAPPLPANSARPRSPMGAASGDGHHVATDDYGGRARRAGQLTSSSLLAESQAVLQSPEPLGLAQSFSCRCQRLACKSADCSHSNGDESGNSSSSSSKARLNNGRCLSKSFRGSQADAWGQLDCSPANAIARLVDEPMVVAKSAAVPADEMGNRVTCSYAIATQAITAQTSAVDWSSSSQQSAGVNQASCRSVTLVGIESAPPMTTMTPPSGAQNSSKSAANIGLASKSPTVWRRIKQPSSSLVLLASRWAGPTNRSKRGHIVSAQQSRAAAAVANFGSHDDGNGGARCASDRSNHHKACQRSANSTANINSVVSSDRASLEPSPKQQLHNFLLTSDPSELGELIKMLMLALASRNSRRAPDFANGDRAELSPRRRHDNENIAMTATTYNSTSSRLMSANC